MNEPGVTRGGPGGGRRLAAVGSQVAVSAAVTTALFGRLPVKGAAPRAAVLRAAATVACGVAVAVQPTAPASRTAAVSIAAAPTAADRLPLPLTCLAPVFIGIPQACGSIPRRSRRPSPVPPRSRPVPGR